MPATYTCSLCIVELRWNIVSCMWSSPGLGPLEIALDLDRLEDPTVFEPQVIYELMLISLSLHVEEMLSK